jgi:Sec-independent protein translocase protein TatA
MSISEIFLILLVALLVVKPERLPEVALMLGKWLRRVRMISTKIKNDFLELGK